jgi:phosphoribosyl 1,2-cyclic phosphate phosphodiesterase
MKLTFLGTGTSMGVPVAGGFSYDSPSFDPRDYRLRVSAFIQTEKASVLIDIGPDFRFQSLRSGIKKIDLLLITHEHADHIGGLDDLRPYNYVQKKPIKTIASPTCIQSIKERFPYMFPPFKTPGSVDFEFLPVSLFQTYSYKDLEITPFPVRHGSLEVWAYKINDLVFITDLSHINEDEIELCKNCNQLVISGLRMSPTHPTHFTIPEAIEVIHKINPKNAWLVHMNSQVKQDEIQPELPNHIRFAHDLLVISC